MSEKWEDIFKEKLEDLESPLTYTDLSEFRSRLDESRKEKAITGWRAFYGMAATLAAAVIALCLLLPHVGDEIRKEHAEDAVSVIGKTVSEEVEEPIEVVNPRPVTNTVIAQNAGRCRNDEQTGIENENEKQNDSEKTSTEARKEVNEQPTENAADRTKEGQESKPAHLNTVKPFDFKVSESRNQISSRKKRNSRIITISSGSFASAALTSLLVSSKTSGTRGSRTGGQSSLSQEWTNPGTYYPVGDSDSDGPGASGIKKEDRTSSESYKHDMPFHVSLSIRYPISERLSLNSGLNYSLYNSHGRNASESWKQSSHYLGIPLRLDFSFVDTRFLTIYAGAGPEIDWCLKASRNGSDISRDGPGISINLAAGLQFNFIDNLGLFVEPRGTWLIPTDRQILNTWRNDHPISFNISFGLRYTIKAHNHD